MNGNDLDMSTLRSLIPVPSVSQDRLAIRVEFRHTLVQVMAPMSNLHERRNCMDIVSHYTSFIEFGIASVGEGKMSFGVSTVLGAKVEVVDDCSPLSQFKHRETRMAETGFPLPHEKRCRLMFRISWVMRWKEEEERRTKSKGR